jgi:hypothetical protein
VPCTTLRDRISGHQFRPKLRANNHKLTQIEEESLKKRIISMDDRGSAPTHLMVKEMCKGSSLIRYV